MSKAKPKKEAVGGALTRDAPSNASMQDLSARKRPTGIWPEWSDSDVQTEKWDTGLRGPTSNKPPGKGIPNTSGAVFEDPEGPCELPASLSVCSWRRPHELDLPNDVILTVVDPRSLESFDLMSNNQTPHESELMRWITSEISSLWKISELPLTTDTRSVSAGPISTPINNNNNAKSKIKDRPPTSTQLPNTAPHSWYPWDHIYSMSRTSAPDGRTSLPVYNPAGKYIVKLYWMGCWRKLVVDDSLPFDSNDKLLLPCTALSHELWPMLLTKALLKVAALDYQAGASVGSEFGDFSAIHCLTAWLPEVIPLRSGDNDRVWEFLCKSLPQYKWPEPAQQPIDCPTSPIPPEANEAPGKAGKTDGKKKGNDVKETKPVGKDDSKKRRDKPEKEDKDKPKDGTEENFQYESPEVIVFASYQGLPKHQIRISMLSEMADASECLRQNHLSHHYPHPVLLSQTRTCPLDPPPPPPNLPAWKLIRPKKPNVLPKAEPQQEAEPEKPIQSVKMTSNFLKYRTRPLNLPSEWFPEEIENETEDTGDGTIYVPMHTDLSMCDRLAEEREQLRMEEEASSAAALAAEIPIVEANEKPDSKGKAGKKKGKKEATVDAGGDKDSKGKKKGKTDAAESAIKTDDTNVTSGSRQASNATGSAACHPAKPSFDFWMDYATMCKCFRTLYVYHKPHTYQHSQRATDFSKVQIQGAAQTGTGIKPERRLAPSATGSATNLLEGKSPLYLFVDSLCSIELVFSLSALSAWHDGVAKNGIAAEPTGAETTAVNQKPAADKSSRDYSPTAKQKTAVGAAGASEPVQTGSVTGLYQKGAAGENISSVVSLCDKEILQPGLLIVEPFSWKSLVTRQPVLRLRTTSTRTALVCVPAGRHVLRLTTTAPLCYHIQVCSTTNFTLGDEDTVMGELTKESCRYVDTARRSMLALGRCMLSYGDPCALQTALDDLWSLHCPHSYVKQMRDRGQSAVIKCHEQVYREAMYTVLRKALADKQLVTSELIFALRVFNRDCTTRHIFPQSQLTSNRPVTAVPAPTERSGQQGTSKKGSNKKRDVENSRVEYWKAKDVTCSELKSIVTLQSIYRGRLTRRILQCYTTDSAEMIKIQEHLQKIWSFIEPHLEEYGLVFYKTLLQLNPFLLPHFSFYLDEWNKISYAEYSGTYTEQPPNTWFLLFREIFSVQEAMLCVPRLIVPGLPTARLRVIDNDTGCEVPQVFFQVAPYNYTVNKTGYTFLCEARSGVEPVTSGPWRLRMIGSLNPLPVPLNTELSAAFHTIQRMDYYVPNDDNLICRYRIMAGEQLLNTIRLHTSSSDAQFSLTLLDFDRVVARVEGRGQAVLPAVLLQPDPTQILQDDRLRSTSRSSARLKSSVSQQGNKKQSLSASTKDTGRLSILSRENSTAGTVTNDGDTLTEHKYIVEARLVRTGWPLTEDQCNFIQSLNKENTNANINHSKEESVELKRSSSAASKQSTVSKGSKERASSIKPKQTSSESKISKDRDRIESTTSALVFDECRPGWTLSVIVDGNKADTLSIERDSEREEYLRVIKKAWEDAEPGRAAKALQSRIKYLNSHAIRTKTSDTTETAGHTEQVKQSSDEVRSGRQTGSGDQLDRSVEQTLDKSRSFDSNIKRPSSGVTSGQEEQKLASVTPRSYTEHIPPLDLSPFIRGGGGVTRLKEDTDIQREIERQREEIARYREYRQQVEQWRERERQVRNYHKSKQLHLIEQLQETLDMLRAGLDCPREKYRQRLLEEETERKRRVDEQAAAEALLAAEQLGAKGGGKKKAANAQQNKK